MAAAQEVDTKEIEIYIKSILISRPTSTNANLLQRELEEELGRPFPLRQLGFRTFVDYLRSIPNVVQLEPHNSSNPNVYPVASKLSQHVDQLVSRQRVAPSKKRGVSRRGSYNSRPAPIRQRPTSLCQSVSRPPVLRPAPPAVSPNQVYPPHNVQHVNQKFLENILWDLAKQLAVSWKNKPSFWCQRCQKEIPYGTWTDILENMYPNCWKDPSRVNWEEIYKCWSIWNSLYESTVSKSKRFSGLSGISSVKVSGEWLFISTSEGKGKLWAQRLTGTDDLIELYVGGGAIIDFELVTSDKESHCKVQPPTKLDEIFDTLEHNEIWLELRDCYIQLGRNYYQHVDKTQQKIRHSYGYEVRLKQNHSHSSVILKKTCATVNGPESMELQLSTRYSHIDFWFHTVTLATNKFDKEFLVDALFVSRRTQETMFTDSLSCSTEGQLLNLYSWHGLLFIILTNRRKITIHCGEKQKEQVTPIRKGQVMSVLFYANYLFLGTDRGKVLIYKVTKPEDCLNIEVFTTPCREIEVCQGKITCLAIAEPVHHKESYERAKLILKNHQKEHKMLAEALLKYNT